MCFETVHEWNGHLEIFSLPQAIKKSRQLLLLRTDIIQKTGVEYPWWKEPFIFFRSLLWKIAFSFFSREERWWHFEEAKFKLKTMRVYSHSYQKRYWHMKRSKQNLFGKVVKYSNLVLNKTCNDNRMLWKQNRLFSRKCAVKILEAMVNNAYKNNLSFHFFDSSSQTS